LIVVPLAAREPIVVANAAALRIYTDTVIVSNNVLMRR